MKIIFCYFISERWNKLSVMGKGENKWNIREFSEKSVPMLRWFFYERIFWVRVVMSPSRCQMNERLQTTFKRRPQIFKRQENQKNYRRKVLQLLVMWHLEFSEAYRTDIIHRIADTDGIHMLRDIRSRTTRHRRGREQRIQDTEVICGCFCMKSLSIRIIFEESNFFVWPQ